MSKFAEEILRIAEKEIKVNPRTYNSRPSKLSIDSAGFKRLLNVNIHYIGL